MEKIKETLKVQNPKTKTNHRLIVYLDVPVQIFERNGWEITCTVLKKSEAMNVYRLEWEKIYKIKE